jgi:hypothetical protein
MMLTRMATLIGGNDLLSCDRQFALAHVEEHDLYARSAAELFRLPDILESSFCGGRPFPPRHC